MARYNPRLAKLNRPYTIEQVSELFGVHKRTVFNWIKDGLPVCVPTRPKLILGRELKEFLSSRQRSKMKPCLPGQIYCVCCKVPQFPKDSLAMITPVNELVGDLIGRCPVCTHKIHRKVSLAKMDTWRGDLTITKELK